MINIPEAATNMVKSFEGFRPNAYQDSKGVWTVGWGFIGDWVKPDTTITQDQAADMLADKLQYYGQAVQKLVDMDKTTDNQFAALIDFAYNLGVNALANSTLLKLHNLGCTMIAADQFLRWDHCNGQVLAGLTRRREAEKALYQTEMQ